jgi:hypothetical protein
MSLFLTFQGRADYNSALGSALSTRAILEVVIGGQPATGYLDTGMPCLVCPPDFAAKVLRLDPADGLEEDALIRGVVVRGRIHNVSVEFVADEGSPLLLQNSLVFVPNNAADVGPDLVRHSFVGMAKCLDSVIFGVDPFRQMFYFQ